MARIADCSGQTYLGEPAWRAVRSGTAGDLLKLWRKSIHRLTVIPSGSHKETRARQNLFRRTGKL
jgi:hypothetical protein